MKSYSSVLDLVEYLPLCLWIIQILYCLSDTTTALYLGIAILLYFSCTKIKNSRYARQNKQFVLNGS